MTPKTSLWTAAGLIVLSLILHACSYVISEGELGIHTRFGKIVGSTTEPGLHIKAPWPIDDLHKLDGRMMLYQGGEEQVLTLDQNSLLVTSHALWQIDPKGLVTFRESVGHEEGFQERFESRLRVMRNGLFGETKFDELFSLNGKKGLDSIENRMMETLQRECREEYGVNLHSVGFSRVTLAPSVLESVYEKMNAERQRISGRIQSEGQAEAARIKAEAQAKYDEAIAKAEGQVQQILGEAEARSLKAYESMAQHSELAIELEKLETLKALLEGRSTLILDRNTPPLDLFHPENK
jgi:modulator of FtsH protease HflC